MMLTLAEEIEASVAAQRLHVALLTALTAVDICGAIDSSNGRTNRNTYAKWFDTYVAPSYSHSHRQLFTGCDCWACRNRLLHQGRTTDTEGKGRYSRFEFLFEKQHNVADFGVLRLDGGDKLLIEVPVLCRNIAYAIHDWLEVVEDTGLFRKNTADAVRILRLSFGS
jgi:hypothetical protein